MPYLLLIIFPIVMSVSCFLLRKQTELVIGTAIMTLLTQMALVVPLPIDAPVRMLGVTLTFTPLTKLFLLAFLATTALTFLVTLRLPHGENFVPVALLTISLVGTILLLQDPFLIALLLVGAGITVVLALVDLPTGASSLVDQQTIIAALKYLVLMVIAGVLIYLAFVLVDIYATSDPQRQVALARLSLALLAVGFAIRLAIIPFHAWLPELVSAASPMVSVLTVGVINVTSLLVLIGIIQIFPVLITANQTGTQVLMVLGLASCVLGGLMAVAQDGPRRMLAYLLAADSGALLFGLASTTRIGLSGAIFGMFNQVIVALLLFVSLALLEQPDGRPPTHQRRDLLRRWPVAGVGFLCGGLALLGLPPFSGFVSRMMLYEAAASRGWAYLLPLLLGTVFGLLALARLARDRLLGPSEDEPIETVEILGITELDLPARRRLLPEERLPAIVTVLLLALTLVLGLYPQPLLAGIGEVVRGLTFIKAL